MKIRLRKINLGVLRRWFVIAVFYLALERTLP